LGEEQASKAKDESFAVPVACRADMCSHHTTQLVITSIGCAVGCCKGGFPRVGAKDVKFSQGGLVARAIFCSQQFLPAFNNYELFLLGLK
jgi:hypothetical protein